MEKRYYLSTGEIIIKTEEGSFFRYLDKEGTHPRFIPIDHKFVQNAVKDEENIVFCPNCKELYGKFDFFISDHKYDMKHWNMCFHCCRHKLGHAGYGE